MFALLKIILQQRNGNYTEVHVLFIHSQDQLQDIIQNILIVMKAL